MAKLLEARGSPAGAAQEKTLLSALQFLNTGLETDLWLLQELRQHPATGKTLIVMIGNIIVVITRCRPCDGLSSRHPIIFQITQADFTGSRSMQHDLGMLNCLPVPSLRLCQRLTTKLFSAIVVYHCCAQVPLPLTLCKLLEVQSFSAVSNGAKA